MINEQNNNDGSFLITEEGDMGLGILEVDPSVITENDKKDDRPKSNLSKK